MIFIIKILNFQTIVEYFYLMKGVEILFIRFYAINNLQAINDLTLFMLKIFIFDLFLSN